MKLTDIAILFSMFFVTLLVIYELKSEMLNTAKQMRQQYNQVIDNAAEDAAYNMVCSDNGRNIEIEKEKVMQQFLLGISAGMQGNMQHSQENFFLYIPVTVFVLDDGFYINYLQKEDDKLKRKFTEKINFEYNTENFEINFTLSDYVKIINRRNGEIFEGVYHDIKQIYPEVFPEKEEDFEQLRRDCVIHTLTGQINKYINGHNNTAKKFGITYHFSLPRIEKEDWYRTINNVGFLAFIQGIPFGTPSMGYFNKFALGASRVRKTASYYIQVDKNTGKKFYHLHNCPVLYNFSLIYDTKKECVAEHSYACPVCTP